MIDHCESTVKYRYIEQNSRTDHDLIQRMINGLAAAPVAAIVHARYQFVLQH